MAALALAASLGCAGCAPKLDPQQYGKVIHELPRVQGADRPYPLPELDEPEDSPKKRAK